MVKSEKYGFENTTKEAFREKVKEVLTELLKKECFKKGD